MSRLSPECCFYCLFAKLDFYGEEEGTRFRDGCLTATCSGFGTEYELKTRVYYLTYATKYSVFCSVLSFSRILDIQPCSSAVHKGPSPHSRSASLHKKRQSFTYKTSGFFVEEHLNKTCRNNTLQYGNLCLSSRWSVDSWSMKPHWR